MSICSFYYITFEAKDDMTSSPPQNFQAYVRRSSEGEKTIEFCRVEQKSELREGILFLFICVVNIGLLVGLYSFFLSHLGYVK